jgi:hypothetical protein
MFARITTIGRGAGRHLRTILVSLLAAVAGCDQEPQWRVVGTDAGDPRPAPGHDANSGGPGHGKPR